MQCKTNCQNNCKQHFTEIQRHNIHEFYWGLGSYERLDTKLCRESPIRRRIQNVSASSRQKSKVLQQFLLSTLAILQMTLRYAVNNTVQKSAKPDERGKQAPSNKTQNEVKLVHNCIKIFPAMPSHYCRNKTTRLYLPNDFRNISFLCRIFLKHLEEESLSARPSLKVFKEIFRIDFTLGFYQPKKDVSNL